ncbi:MAG: hypothetical protein U0519_00420 [Candidatus Gracilibacteria bacterium]
MSIDTQAKEGSNEAALEKKHTDGSGRRTSGTKKESYNQFKAKKQEQSETPNHLRTDELDHTFSTNLTQGYLTATIGESMVSSKGELHLLQSIQCRDYRDDGRTPARLHQLQRETSIERAFKAFIFSRSFR